MSVYSRITAVSSRKIVIVISYGNGAAAPCIGNTCSTICSDITIAVYYNLIYGTARYFTYDIAGSAIAVILNIPIIIFMSACAGNKYAVIGDGTINNGAAVKFAGNTANGSIFGTKTTIIVVGTF